MLRLAVSNLHWIEPGDQPTDLCAHGTVDLVVDGQVLSSGEDGDWCVSAAAVHLLRTTTASHTAADPVAEFLIPCCGHFVVPPDDDDGDVTIIGCNIGIDWQIIHSGKKLSFILPNGRNSTVDAASWSIAVCDFSDKVQDFYRRSQPKLPGDEFERAGFAAMMAEWKRRRADHQESE